MANVKGTTESLDWDYAAFDIVKTRFIAEWGQLRHRYQSLQETNQEIYEYLTQNTLLMRPVNNSPSLGVRKLFRLVHQAIVFYEPFLYRIFLHNAIDPGDIQSRGWLLDNYLSHREIGSVRDLLSEQVSDGLRKGYDLTSSRVYRWLSAYIDSCDHYRLIDMVKETGVEEPVEELRETRIYQTAEGTVFDYSPIFKFIRAGDHHILEYLNKEDYAAELQKYDLYTRDAGNTTLPAVKKARTRPDPQGKPADGLVQTHIEHSRYKLTIRYKGLKKTIPFELGRAYRSKAIQEAWEHSLPQVARKEKASEALQGLLKGMADWEPRKGPGAPWISENIRWQTGSAARDALKSKQQELLRYPDEIGDDTSIDSIAPVIHEMP